jgi:hypothetical protein
MNQSSKYAAFVLMVSILLAILVANEVLAPNLIPSPTAKTNSWSSTAPMPTQRWQFGVAVVDGKIYAVGGMGESREGPIRLNVTEEFNPSSAQWLSKQNIPYPSAAFPNFPFGVTACDGKIYVFGVIGYVEPIVVAVLVYDPSANSWETLEPAPINASADTSVTANTVNGKIYVMGETASSSFNMEYDPEVNSWTAKSVPSGLIGSVVCALDNKIYALGGKVNGENDATLFQVYDTIADMWSVLKPLPSKMVFGAAVSTSGIEAPKRLYLFGSFVGVYSGSFMYNPASESWTAFEAIPADIEYFSIANVNDQIYLMGGVIPPFISGYPQQTFVYTPFGYGGAPIPTAVPSSTPIQSVSPTTPTKSQLPNFPPTVEWSQIYSSGQSQDIIQTRDGGYLIAGSTLIKTNAKGSEQWSVNLSSIITAQAVVQTNDGFAVGGIGTGNQLNSFVLVKTDFTGKILWNKTYSNFYANVGEDDHFCRLFSTSDGGYILSGTANAYTGAHKPAYPWLLKVNSEGDIVWSQMYAQGNMLTAMQTKDGGCAFITPFAKESILLLKVDAFGQMQWNHTYADLSNADSAIQANDGGYAILATGSAEGDSLLAKTDQNGSIQWIKAYASPSNKTILTDLAKTDDDGYVLMGSINKDSSALNTSGIRTWILKTDSCGNPQWNQTYGGPNGTEGRAIIQTGDEGYAVAGQVEHYKEVNTNWPPFIYLLKLSYQNPADTSPDSDLVPLALAILACIIAIALIIAVLKKQNKFLTKSQKHLLLYHSAN